MKFLNIYFIQSVYFQTGVAKPDKIENTDFKLDLNKAAHNEVLSNAKLHLFLIPLFYYIRVEL